MISLTSEQERRLQQLMAAFLYENSLVNLSALRTAEVCWPGNILDSINVPAAPTGSVELLDFGTGGGFPLLPLAILHPDWRCTGLDSTAKKLEAVKRICTVCDIPKIRLIHERAETLAKNAEHRGRYDIVTARAVAKLPVLIERCAPLCKEGGQLWFWKSLHIAEELAEAASAAQRLRCVLQTPHLYSLPGDFGERQIVVYRKI